jgi:hypothetical protein
MHMHHRDTIDLILVEINLFQKSLEIQSNGILAVNGLYTHHLQIGDKLGFSGCGAMAPLFTQM